MTLDHGHPFFASVSDSQGVTWSNGPLHAGAGSRACLSPPPPHSWLTLSASLGMSFSFLIFGILLTSLCAWFIAFRRPVQFANAATDETRALDATKPRENKATPSSIQDNARLSRTESSRRGTAPAAERGVASGNIFSGLHLRRPSTTRAPSSEIGLLSRRSTVRREEPRGSLDLAASPTEDQQRPFKFGQETSHRSKGEGVIIPWTSTNATQRPAAEAPTSPTAYQRNHFVSNSNSSGPNPDAAGTSTTAFRALLPTHGHPSPSGHVPNIATPQPRSYHPHHGSFSSTTAPLPTSPQLGNRNSQLQSHDVYVVHHDGGLPPPVTVFALPGTRVTELPPGYDHVLATTPGQEGTTRSPREARTKPSPSAPSIASPTRPPLQTQVSDRSASSGMALVNSEDLPQSTTSPSERSSMPLPPERGYLL